MKLALFSTFTKRDERTYTYVSRPGGSVRSGTSYSSPYKTNLVRELCKSVLKLILAYLLIDLVFEYYENEFRYIVAVPVSFLSLKNLVNVIVFPIKVYKKMQKIREGKPVDLLYDVGIFD